MRFLPLILLFILCAGSADSQEGAFPLESVTIEGSTIPQAVILEIAGLQLAAPIDKAGIEQACKKLQDSGIFASIAYTYAPGPKNGYALTLNLTDQTALATAVIDVAGADENEAWQWVSAKFRRFDHQAPQADAAQKYLAGELEQHLRSQLHGQHLTVRMETDLKTRKLTLLFQPEVLPKIQEVSFLGNEVVASKELAAALNPILLNSDYTDRKFAAAIEMNLRPVYEERGYCRVKFVRSNPKQTSSGVSLSIAITEGARYQLRQVDVVGESLPVNAMLSAAKFPEGKLANWTQIQAGIWEMEKVVKRMGFFEATASPERSYDDTAHVLDLHIRMAKGPLYHFGEMRITGLRPDLEGRAKRIWKLTTGDPFDYAYPSEFFQALSRAVDLRNFKYNAVARKGAGDHVMDVNLVFELR